jgi:excisionase family DNA binding protein
MDVELPRVMTVEEVAEYLRIPRGSVYKLAQRGKIPCQKVGRHWRFRREAVDKWLDNGNPGANQSHWAAQKDTSGAAKG